MADATDHPPDDDDGHERGSKGSNKTRPTDDVGTVTSTTSTSSSSPSPPSSSPSVPKNDGAKRQPTIQKIHRQPSTQKVQKQPTKQQTMKQKKQKKYKGPAVDVLNAAGYQVVSQVGHGAYSKVFKVVRRNKEYAVKVITPRNQSIRYNTQMLPRELKILTRVRHPNIVRVREIYQHPKRDFVLIVMAYAPNGTMKEWIKNHGPYKEAEARIMFKGMAAAIDAMHSMQDPIAHRDLKTDNVLIDAKFNPVITDFSYTRYCKDHTIVDGANADAGTDNGGNNDASGNNNGAIKDATGYRNVLSQTFCGTEPFLAPEVLMNRPYDPLPADVWSLGVCLFCMLNGKKPFHGEGDSMVHAQRSRNYKYVHPFDQTLSNDVKDLISKMLEPNPHKRLTIREVLHHNWLK